MHETLHPVTCSDLLPRERNVGDDNVETNKLDHHIKEDEIEGKGPVVIEILVIIKGSGWGGGNLAESLYSQIIC